MSDFHGFPEAALDFYEGLESDNSKAYWTDHKAVYDEAVQAPVRALLAALEPEFGSVKFFRPYRDVRFSKDKSPDPGARQRATYASARPATARRVGAARCSRAAPDARP